LYVELSQFKECKRANPPPLSAVPRTKSGSTQPQLLSFAQQLLIAFELVGQRTHSMGLAKSLDDSVRGQGDSALFRSIVDKISG